MAGLPRNDFRHVRPYYALLPVDVKFRFSEKSIIHWELLTVADNTLANNGDNAADKAYICRKIRRRLHYMVTVIWETWLKSGAEDEGLALTQRIWSDMQGFEGYRSHTIFRDQDEKGHLFVISQWSSREAADRIRNEYATAEPVRLITPLLAKPRNRWVCNDAVK